MITYLYSRTLKKSGFPNWSIGIITLYLLLITSSLCWAEDEYHIRENLITEKNTNLYQYMGKDACTATISTDDLYLFSSPPASTQADYFCGAAPPPRGSTPSGVTVLDRFGHSYAIPRIPTSNVLSFQGNMEDCGCGDDFDTGFFSLFFEDVDLGTGTGFDAPATLGEHRRAVLCEVFAYLSSVISPNPSACSGEIGQVVIQVIPSSANDYYGRGPLPPLSGNRLAYASAYYPPNPEKAINHGFPWLLINSGELPLAFGSAELHGYVRFDFDGGETWNLDTESTNFSNNDLYSVALHEAIHILGVSSGIDNQGAYREFDRHLVRSTIMNSTPILQNNPEPGFNWAQILSPNLLLWECSDPITTARVLFDGTLGNYPIFTDNIVDIGGSFSHLNEDCASLGGGQNYYVMSPSYIEGEVKRVPHPHELDILSVIGYNIDGSGCAIGGVDDGSETCNGALLVGLCDGDMDNPAEICVNASTLLENDAGSNLQINHIELLTPAMGTLEVVTNNSGMIDLACFKPVRLGLARLAYTALGCNGQETNITYVSINVVPSADDEVPENCEFDCTFLSCEELNFPDECTSYPICDLLASSCENLICNASICASTAADPNGASRGFSRLTYPDLALSGWIPTHGTPDFFYNFQNYQEQQLLHFFATTANNNSGASGPPNFSEGLLTYTKILPNNQYFFSLRTKAIEFSSQTPSAEIGYTVSLIDGSGLDLASSNPGTELPNYTGVPQQVILEEIPTNDFSTFVLYRTGSYFTVTSPDVNALWFYSDPSNAPIGIRQDFIIDDIELIPDNFTAGEDITTEFCAESVTMGGHFCAPYDVRVLYEWFSVNEAGAETLIGSYEAINDQTSNFQGISAPIFTVAPLVGTIYRVRRTILDAAGLPDDYFDDCPMEDDRLVIVNNPVPDATFTFDDDPCVSTENFVSTGNIDGNHSWSFGNPVIGTSTEVNPTFDFGTLGIYEVTHQVENDCSSSSVTETLTIILFPPDANFSFDIDINGQVNFTSDNPQLGDQYAWNFGDGSAIVNEANPSHVYESGLYDVTLTVSSPCGSEAITQQVFVPNISSTCDDCTGGNTFGIAGQSTPFSVEISQGDYSNQVYCIQGDLVINAGQEYNFSNCAFRMQEGASITIKKDGKLTIDRSALQGCNAMWRGIIAEQGATLTLKNTNTILDAQYAVYAEPSTTNTITNVFVSNNFFKNNFVGIYVAELPGVLSLLVSDNEFGIFPSLSTLKMPYSGQTSAPEGLPEQKMLPLAGMIIQPNANIFNLANNNFSNMTSGIVINGASARVLNSQFSNISENVANYPTYLQAGHATFSRGLGNALALYENEMTNCTFGAGTKGVTFIAYSNTLSNLTKGFDAELDLPGKIFIGGTSSNTNVDLSNTITNVQIGIEIDAVDPNIDLSILGNTIEVNTNTFGSGIRINDSKANGQIENNSIDLLQAGHGIYLSFAENCIVFDNTINMLDPLQANYGIYLAGVTKCAITENTISGSGTTGNGNVGLRIIFSPGNTYCCNNFDQTQVGTYVLGPSSATNQFKGNTFGTNGTDLLIDQNLNPNILQSVLGSQEHTQNQWVGNNSSAIYEGATPEFAQQFPFFVDLSSNPNFLPNVVTPIGWFDNTPSTGILAPCPEESCLSIEAIDLNEPDIIKIVNNGSVIPYIEVVRWELRRFLYRDIKGRNSSNSIINSFKAAASNNTIGGFEEVDNGVRKIYSFSPTNISLTESHIDQTLSDLDALQAIDDQLVSAVGANFNSLSNSREQLIESSALNSLALGASQQNLRTGRGERATLLHPINSTIATLTTFEENEKVINEDVLSYFQNGELSTSSLARLQAIAYQCPFEGGLAVYRAQALLRRITNKAIEFPDNFDCLSNNSIQGMANGAFTNTSSNTIQVFPNPSTHEATVSWSIPIQQQGQLVLYDMIGKPIEQIPLEIGMEQQRFSVQNLPSGIYLLHVQIDGKSEVIKLLHN